MNLCFEYFHFYTHKNYISQLNRYYSQEQKELIILGLICTRFASTCIINAFNFITWRFSNYWFSMTAHVWRQYIYDVLQYMTCYKRLRHTCPSLYWVDRFQTYMCNYLSACSLSWIINIIYHGVIHVCTNVLGLSNRLVSAPLFVSKYLFECDRKPV